MRIMAIDIGAGTQDIILYDTEREVENSLLMIMPSPTVIVARRIHDATSGKKSIFLKGGLMGGGSSAKAVRQHLEQGLKVYATWDAALTINDDLEKVKEIGVRIVDGNEIPRGNLKR